jgi:hypothetical protein
MHPMVMTEIAKIRMEERRGEAAGRGRVPRRHSWRLAIGLRLVEAGWRIAGARHATSNRIEVRT